MNNISILNSLLFLLHIVTIVPVSSVYSQSDSVPLQDQSVQDTSISNHKSKCACNDYIKKPVTVDSPCNIYEDNFRVTCFNRSSNDDLQNNALFRCMSAESNRSKITNICFNEYDSIPGEFRVFSNVETVALIDCKSIRGLDIFPNLKALHIYACFCLEINDNEEWLNGIEEIKIYKTVVSGPSSFSFTPNLRYLLLEYSGFIRFPDNFSELKCLQNLCIRHYLKHDSCFEDTITPFNPLDLDRSRLPCLKTGCAE